MSWRLTRSCRKQTPNTKTRGYKTACHSIGFCVSSPFSRRGGNRGGSNREGGGENSTHCLSLCWLLMTTTTAAIVAACTFHSWFCWFHRKYKISIYLFIFLWLCINYECLFKCIFCKRSTAAFDVDFYSDF